jgi:hypothetical protein
VMVTYHSKAKEEGRQKTRITSPSHHPLSFMHLAP